MSSLTKFLAAAALLQIATVEAASSTEWPYSVQPFWLSALGGNLTAADASYLGKFPLVVVNHKQGPRSGPGQEEEAQLFALAQVKATNASCQTFFYLNSQIDFSPLKLHEEFVKNGSWWLKNDDGTYVDHKGNKIFDFTVAEARSAWLATAEYAISQPYISGVFVDKAGGFGSEGISPARNLEWVKGHFSMLKDLGDFAAANKKQVIFNSAGVVGLAGQLFERWGEYSDHDGLNVTADLELLEQMSAASNAGHPSILRAGGGTPGSGSHPAPEVCGAALAAMLVAVQSPNAAFFACQPDFNSKNGWMDMGNDPIFQRYLGAPKGKAVVGKDGLLRRAFDGANVTLNTTAYSLCGRSPFDLNSGCVEWSSGETTGTCP